MIYHNPAYYSSADLTNGNHTVTNGDPVAYLNPKKAKSSANDYEEYHMANMYEQPQKCELHTPAHLPNPYEMAESSTISIEDNTPHFGKELSDGEPIYEDPGHVKESIYEWLEQKGIFKLDKRTIRCSGNLTYNDKL